MHGQRQEAASRPAQDVRKQPTRLDRVRRLNSLVIALQIAGHRQWSAVHGAPHRLFRCSVRSDSQLADITFDVPLRHSLLTYGGSSSIPSQLANRLPSFAGRRQIALKPEAGGSSSRHAVSSFKQPGAPCHRKHCHQMDMAILFLIVIQI